MLYFTFCFVVCHHFGLVSIDLTYTNVLLYMFCLTFGRLDAETEQGVAQAIIRSVLDFRRDPWPKVSDNAKDLVRKMLDPDPKRRLTAQEVLGIDLALKEIQFLSK